MGMEPKSIAVICPSCMKVMTLIINRKEGDVNKCAHCGAVKIKWKSMESKSVKDKNSV
jgi:NMD protein affecting ribosome stability and mRNA decay